MSVYSVVKFLHIVGAIGFFITLALEWIGLAQMRTARTLDQVREWMDLPRRMRGAGMVSILVLLAAGIYMAVIAWGLATWIAVALAAIVLSIALSAALTGPRMAAVEKALAEEQGSMSPSFQSLLHDPRLWVSIQTRVAIGLGIVFLMTVKPGLVGSILVIGIAAVLGAASALLPMFRRERVQEGSTD